jgi:hypothetical protein
MEGLNLSYRNAARLLGRKENWCKRLVTKAFGEEVCNNALTLTQKELEEIKRLRVAYFESLFTEEDRAMEAALQRAAERTYFDCYETEEDI